MTYFMECSVRASLTLGSLQLAITKLSKLGTGHLIFEIFIIIKREKGAGINGVQVMHLYRQNAIWGYAMIHSKASHLQKHAGMPVDSYSFPIWA